MEKTNKIVKSINSVFEVICFVYDSTELNFETGGVFVELLKKTLEKANTINIKEITIEITMEVWNATSKIHREEKIIDLLNTKFNKLLTWKPGIYSIDEMNSELLKDLGQFYEKQHRINRRYSDLEKNMIGKFYIAIGHRLLKANLDMNKVMAELRKMEEAESSTSKDSAEEFFMKFNNIRVSPDKTSEFAAIITDLFDKNFFVPIDSTTSFSKTIVISALAELLHCELKSVNSSTQTMPIQIAENILPTDKKSFHNFLLHSDKLRLAEEIRKEFSTEKGKAIRLLINTLENSTPPLITIGYRQAKDLHKAMSEYFNKDIGTYQSVFNYKISKYDQRDLENTEARLNHILNSLSE